MVHEVDEVNPGRFEEPAPELDRSAEIVDGWLRDFFHGEHHVKVLASPYAYLCQAAVELKQRLKR
jgi:hypothetical protein